MFLLAGRWVLQALLPLGPFNLLVVHGSGLTLQLAVVLALHPADMHSRNLRQTLWSLASSIETTLPPRRCVLRCWPPPIQTGCSEAWQRLAR